MNCCNSGLIMGEKGRCVKIDGLIGKRLVNIQNKKNKAAKVIQNALRKKNEIKKAKETLNKTKQQNEIKQRIKNNYDTINSILQSFKKMNINPD
jgi:hypothetical protein